MDEASSETLSLQQNFRSANYRRLTRDMCSAHAGSVELSLKLIPSTLLKACILTPVLNPFKASSLQRRCEQKIASMLNNCPTCHRRGDRPRGCGHVFKSLGRLELPIDLKIQVLRARLLQPFQGMGFVEDEPELTIQEAICCQMSHYRCRVWDAGRRMETMLAFIYNPCRVSVSYKTQDARKVCKKIYV